MQDIKHLVCNFSLESQDILRVAVVVGVTFETFAYTRFRVAQSTSRAFRHVGEGVGGWIGSPVQDYV